MIWGDPLVHCKTTHWFGTDNHLMFWHLRRTLNGVILSQGPLAQPGGMIREWPMYDELMDPEEAEPILRRIMEDPETFIMEQSL